MNHISLYAQSLVYIVAGLNHFLNPRTYLAIMPPYIPAHQFMVTISGIAEIILGIGLLFRATQSVSAWGLIFLLIAIFPANVYMATSAKFIKFPAWLRWLRLPLQAVLIWWAYRYT
ncbi:DoxX family protein [Spirosoma aerolatum]|uniref:DoxX family protein n=1 Tax=Spirosoma aerolatum TaxID=1211326 RepID=UPI0009AD7F3A|nr:DoxX family protein [Spirosoma aerolatum]